MSRTAALLAALLCASTALANPTPADIYAHPDVLRMASTAEYAADLRGADRSDRLFAARELRRQALSAARHADGPPSERQLEARVALQDLRADAGRAAIAALADHADVRGPCADILGVLGDPGALPALTAALGAETRPRIRRRLKDAITTLEAGAREASR